MSKRDDYMQGRNEGMAFALKIAKEGGVEALEKEIRMRNIWGLHTNVPMKDIQDIKNKITLRVIDIITCVALLAEELIMRETMIRAVHGMDCL